MELQEGYAFVRLPKPDVLFSNNNRIVGIADYRFYGRFALTVPGGEPEEFDAWVRYYTRSNARNSAIGVIDSGDKTEVRWMSFENGRSVQDCQTKEAVEALVRDDLFNGGWWQFVLDNNIQ